MTSSSSKSPRVLLIDDDSILRRQLTACLERAGMAVSSLPNGVGAEAAALAHRADAIVTDLIMPEREGIETLRALRLALPEIPVVVLTGSAFASMARSFGAREVLHKPIHPNTLVETLLSL